MSYKIDLARFCIVVRHRIRLAVSFVRKYRIDEATLTSVADKVSLASLILCAVFVLTVGHWMTWPYKVMRINNLTVINAEIEAGGYLEYRLDYCKDKEYELVRAQVQLSFRDGIIYNLPIESGSLESGCAADLYVLAVPETIPAGKYHLDMIREYSVNPLRKIEVHATSNIFKVSDQQRLERMLRQQLPKVIPKVIQEIPALR